MIDHIFLLRLKRLSSVEEESVVVQVMHAMQENLHAKEKILGVWVKNSNAKQNLKVNHGYIDIIRIILFLNCYANLIKGGII